MSVRVTRVAQNTDSHCGPAVVQMILARLNLHSTQDEIVRAGMIKSRILRLGARPDHLGKAVKRLFPQYRLWFKNHATIADLETLIDIYKTPVGVNWQGLFYDSLEEEKKHSKDEDHGHYSIIVGIDRPQDQVTLVDPFFPATNRHFSYTWFKTRWWDTVIETNSLTKEKYTLKTKRFIFVILPKHSPVPKKMNMQPAHDFVFLAH